MTRKPKPQLNLQDMEYVIYCRKSTDDSSGQQTQSIPDQIRKCVDYAHSN
jgi:hypothetical protein